MRVNGSKRRDGLLHGDTNRSRERGLIDAASRVASELASAAVSHHRTPFALAGFGPLIEISRGGQGVVYRAIQNDTGREVAIKVVADLPDDSPRQRARFEREIRILGGLKHPNIVPIHGSGEQEGRRYFVMDYVRGEALDTYAASRSDAVLDLLRLFENICSAVGAAHDHGVIHRDLKPSNIRVDAHGEPHILDFGLAKFSRAPGDRSLDDAQRSVTVTGQFLGSLPWASPEQVQTVPDEVDVRADIYALGLLLFHMLTGGFPYPVDHNPHQTMRSIVETEASRPSSIRKDLDSDLDNIVLKCLQKSPARRYQTTAELVDDLRRFLRGEPILARAPSTAYLVRKLVQRHRLLFVMLTALLVALMGFSVGMTILFKQASAERRRAVEAERLAEARRMESEREAKTSQAVTDFLINDVLASASPSTARGRSITVAEAFEIAAHRVSTAFVADPILRASVLSRVGEVYCGLGLYKDAIAPLREASDLRATALGETNAATLETKRQLLDALLQHGAYLEAEPIAKGMYESLRDSFGDDHLETLQAASRVVQVDWFRGRVAEAIQLYASVYGKLVATVGEDHPAVIYALSQHVASELLEFENLEKSEDLFRRGLNAARARLGDDAPETIRLMTSVGITLMRQRHFTEADDLLQRSVRESRRVLGEPHLDSIIATVYLSALQQQQGLLREAEANCQRAYDLALEQFGEEHWPTIWTLERLADIKTMRGNHGAALEIERRVVTLKQRIREPGDLSLCYTWDTIGVLLFRLDRYDEAVDAQRTALKIYGDAAGALSVQVGTLRGLVYSLGAAGRSEEARPFTENWLRLRRVAAEAATSDAYAMNTYASALLRAEPADLRNPREALQFAMRAFEITTDEFGVNRYTVGLCHEALGNLPEAADWVRRGLRAETLQRSIFRSEMENALERIFTAMGDRDGAENVYRETLEARRNAIPHDDEDIAESLDDLGRLLIEHGKFAEAETLLRESLELRSAIVGANDWRTARTQSLLGAGIASLSRMEEAAPLLIESAARLAACSAAPLAAVRDAQDRAHRWTSFPPGSNH